MPLQNRITPFSTIIATTERGHWTGNRGVIHNDYQQIVKNHAVKYWITCRLEYKGMRRSVMSPNRWTELFFLDEATAFAAGHRPCGFCRHADFKRFKNIWLVANGEKYGLSSGVKMDVIDNFIHQERLDENGKQRTYKAVLDSLPDGAFVSLNGGSGAYLWFRNNLYLWSFGGYSPVLAFEPKQEVDVLTPVGYVHVFRAGYVPQVHVSALKKE